MVKSAAARKLGLSAKRVKDTSLWFQLVYFALLYGIHNQGYWHIFFCTMGILSFGAMCRYSDVNRLRWRNVQFDNDINILKILLNIERIRNFVNVTKLPWQILML